MKQTALILFLSLLFWAPQLRAELTKAQFKQDLNFYRSTAKVNNLSANDRLFILNRIREKYKGAEFDITELYGEIDKWSSKRIKEKKSEEEKAAAGDAVPAEIRASAPSGAEPQTAKLTKLSLTDEKDLTRLTLNVPGLGEYKEIPVQSEGGGSPSAAVIYLYQTQNKLRSSMRSMRLKKGYVKEIQVKRVAAKPPTVKVSVSFRKSSPYDIERSGDDLILNVYNAAPAWLAQGPTPQEAVDAALETAPESEAAEAPEFKPASLTPTPFTLQNSSQVIEPGQIVTFEIIKYPEFTKTTVAAPDGNAPLSPLGQTMAAGFLPSQLEKIVAKKMESVFLKSAVKISVKEFDAANHVALVGSVKNSGSYAHSKGLGCYNLISRSGGFEPGANKKAVLIHRMTQQSRKKLLFDVEAYTESADPSGDFILEAGDVIEVRKNPSTYVYGEVNVPGFYKLKENVTLSQAVAAAGGLTDRAEPSKMILIHPEEGNIVKSAFDLNQARQNPDVDPILSDGDLIYAEAKKGKNKLFTKETVTWGAFFMSLGLVLALLI